MRATLLEEVAQQLLAETLMIIMTNCATGRQEEGNCNLVLRGAQVSLFCGARVNLSPSQVNYLFSSAFFFFIIYKRLQFGSFSLVVPANKLRWAFDFGPPSPLKLRDLSLLPNAHRCRFIGLDERPSSCTPASFEPLSKVGRLAASV